MEMRIKPGRSGEHKQEGGWRPGHHSGKHKQEGGTPILGAGRHSGSSGYQAGKEWACEGGKFWRGSSSWSSWTNGSGSAWGRRGLRLQNGWDWKRDSRWQGKDTEATSAKDTSQDSHVGEEVAWNHAQREQIGACEGSLLHTPARPNPLVPLTAPGSNLSIESLQRSNTDDALEEDCRDALCAILNNSGLVSDTNMQPWTDASLFQVERQEDSSLFVASLHLPFVRKSLGTSLKSDPCPTEELAKVSAAKKAVQALKSQEQPRRADSPGMQRSACKLDWPLHLPSGADKLLKDISAETPLLIYQLEGNGLKDIGFLGTFPSKYTYQLEVECMSMCIHPISERHLKLDTDHVNKIFAFHNSVFFDETEETQGVQSSRALSVVRLTCAGELDWGAMEKQASTVCQYYWLQTLWQRVLHLQELELLAENSPIMPVPSPLKLEAVACESGSFEGSSFEVLRMFGRVTLEMLGALTAFGENTVDGPEMLEQRVRALIGEERCKALIHESANYRTFLQAMAVCRVSEDLAVGYVEALLGAFACEDDGGDSYSVCMCWEWLVDSNEITDGSLMYANYRTQNPGSTADIEYFREAEVEGVPTLQVYYKDYGNVWYQRPVVEIGGIGLELRKDVHGSTWLPLVWDRGKHQILSTSLDPKPLANKVSMWLRGRGMAKLVPVNRRTKIKKVHCKSLSCDTLREQRCGTPILGAGRSGIGNETCLVVSYTGEDRPREYYRGSTGNLGYESIDGVMKPLYYSESTKTLISPHDRSPKQHLPETVVDWICSTRSLSQLLLHSGENTSDVELEVNKQERCVMWSAHGVKFKSFSREILGGFLLLMEGIDGESEELAFAWESKRWLRPSDQEPLPSKVLRQLQHMAESPFKSPCAEVQNKLPKLLMKHEFNKPAFLLLQALWYPSIEMQRLAFVGSRVFHALVVKVLLGKATFSTAATVRRYGSPPTEKISRAETADPSTEEDRPQGSGAMLDDDSPSRLTVPGSNVSCDFGELESRIKVCCSHIACAVTAVKFGLDIVRLQSQSPCLSQQFKKQVKYFAFIAKRNLVDNLQKSSHDWAKVLAVGAPRILGDALHAVVGAIVLDQGGLEDALALVQDHVVDCAALQFPGEVDGKAVRALETNVANANTSSPSQGALTEPGNLLLQEQSPRSLALRAPFMHQDLEPLEALEALEEQPQPTDPPTNSVGAVYCPVCQQWCNSLVQYEGPGGHAHGKKHRKNLKSQQQMESAGRMDPPSMGATMRQQKRNCRNKAKRPQSLPGALTEPGNMSADRASTERVETFSGSRCPGAKEESKLLQVAQLPETVAGQSQNCSRMLPFGQPNMTSFGEPPMMLEFPEQHVLTPMQSMPLISYFDGVPPGQEAWNQSNWLSHQSDGQQWSDQDQEWWQGWWQGWWQAGRQRS